MKNTISDSVLSDHISSICSNYEEYINLRREITYNYSSAMFINFILGKPPSLEGIFLDTCNGSVYTENHSFDISNNDLEKSNPNEVRLSRNVVKFIGDIGIEGVMTGIFTAMARALTRPKFYTFKEYTYILLYDIFWINNYNLNSDEIAIINNGLINKLHWLFFEDYNKKDYKKDLFYPRVNAILQSYIDADED